MKVLEWLLKLPVVIVAPVAVALLLGIVVLIVAAFVQGREISFWPPRIGPKPPPESRRKSSVAVSSVAPKEESQGLPTARAQPSRMIRERGHASKIEEPGHDELIDWSGVRLRYSSLVMLKLLAQSDHSTIHTCHVPDLDGVFVAKRTNAELCDFEALQMLVAVRRGTANASAVVPHAVWRESNYVCELQPLVEGPSLGRIVMRNRQPVARGALLRQLLTHITDELNWLRSINIVHRDVTPFNIILGKDRLALIDWSFCCKPGRTQVAVATQGFASPDQLRGQATNASDWYGFSSTLAFLAIGDGEIRKREQYRSSLRSVYRGYGHRLFYVLDNSTPELAGTEEGLIRDLLDSETSIKALHYEPASGPALSFAREIAALRVLEIDSGSHLILGNDAWFMLPRDSSGFAEMLFDLPGAPRSERDLLTAAGEMNPRVAAVLSSNLRAQHAG